MEESANTQLRDKTIAHEIYLQRMYGGTTKDIMKLLKEVEKDLVAKLRVMDMNSEWSIARIDAQLQSVRAIMSEGYSLIGKELTQQMKDAAEYEQEWQIKAIDDSTPVVLDMVAVAPVTLFAAIESKPLQGKLIKEWIDKLDQDSYTRIQDAVRIGLVEGQSYSDVVKRITGTKALQYTDGINSLNARQTQALVSTAMSHATNVASEEFYKANDDLIKGWQFLATLDFKTTTLCKSYDGQKFDLGKGPYPPVHVRCRSSTVPVLKSWKEMGMKDPPPGTRSSLDGQISETINYDEWLRKQSHEKQDEALGKGKAEIFRSGVKLERFVENGKELTLEQLKKIEK
jgi:SPP1 gp7 family putative phage head morphogenesis protein